MVSFEGVYNTRQWLETGFTSLDIACSRVDRRAGVVQLGIPTRVGIHLYANTKVGKSHCALSLGSILSEKLRRSLVFAPIDTFDLESAEVIVNAAGLTREPAVVLEDTDEATVEALRKSFDRDRFAVGILDSVMAISPIAEQEGKAGDANMGRRAKLTSTWVKQMFHTIKTSKEEKIFFAINHLYNNLGTPGTYTPGGKALVGFTSLHIKLQRAYPKIENNLGWLVEGVVEQANFIPHGRMFNLYVIGGYGIHRGLTAVFDCLMFGLAEKNKQGFVVCGDYKARLSALMDHPEDNEMFEPFIQALDDNKASISTRFITKEDRAKEAKKAAKEKAGKRARVQDDEEEVVEMEIDQDTGEVLSESHMATEPDLMEE